MLDLTFAKRRKERLTVLCIGCHSDDIEIGAGGTILELVAAHPAAEFWWVVLSGNKVREREARRSAARFLRGAKAATIVTKDFRDSFFPYRGEAIKESINELRRSVSPDIIFTHCRGDLHQDHRLVAELSWNAFRDHLILEYEIPKYDGDLGQPSFFVPLAEATCRAKARLILRSFPSQKDNHWFTEETFRALLRLRGIESNSPTGYAEAFYARKIVVRP